MKATIDISGELLEDARRVAEREHVTLRELVEAGLRRELRCRTGSKEFELLDGSVGGGWLRPEVQAGGWDALRTIVYEDRGG